MNSATTSSNPRFGLFTRDASNRLTYEIYALEIATYLVLCGMIVEHYKLTTTEHLIVGLDEIFQDWQRGDDRIGLDWDIWSGFMVVAKTIGSENLVVEIGDWLELNRDEISKPSNDR